MCNGLMCPRFWIPALTGLLLLFTSVGIPYGAAENKSANESTELKNDPRLDASRIVHSTASAQPLRILVVGAHPADVFDQSGGTMAHHVQRGDWVGCVVVTTGVRTHDKVVTDQMQRSKELPSAEELKKTFAERADVKVKEVVRACSILGVREQDLHFMGADDVVLLVNEPMIRHMAKLIRTLRPDVILTHFPYENMGLGTGHAIVGQMVVHAIASAAGVDPDDKSPPHKVTQAYFFGQGAAAERSHLWGAQGGFTTLTLPTWPRRRSLALRQWNRKGTAGHMHASASKRPTAHLGRACEFHTRKALSAYTQRRSIICLYRRSTCSIQKHRIMKASRGAVSV